MSATFRQVRRRKTEDGKSPFCSLWTPKKSLPYGQAQSRSTGAESPGHRGEWELHSADLAPEFAASTFRRENPQDTQNMLPVCHWQTWELTSLLGKFGNAWKQASRLDQATNNAAKSMSVSSRSAPGLTPRGRKTSAATIAARATMMEMIKVCGELLNRFSRAIIEQV